MNARGVWHTIICRECGAPFKAADRKVRIGRGKFCSRPCRIRFIQLSHGHTAKAKQSPTYMSWAQMIQRCTNPKHPKFQRFGGAGITVCDEWRSFEVFLRDMGERPIRTSIDRIDLTKGYFPGNCRWGTPVRRFGTSRARIEFRGEQMTLPQIARYLGVNLSTLRYRVRAGWPQQRWAEQTQSQASKE